MRFEISRASSWGDGSLPCAEARRIGEKWLLELNSLEELRYLVGQLSPAMLLVSLVKSALFAAVILWISLDQGARRWRTGRLGNSALSRTIGLSIAVVLTIDLAWVLLLEPSAGGGVA